MASTTVTTPKAISTPPATMPPMRKRRLRPIGRTYASRRPGASPGRDERSAAAEDAAAALFGDLLHVVFADLFGLGGDRRVEACLPRVTAALIRRKNAHMLR